MVTEDLAAKIGRRIAALRGEAGLTQQQLADATGARVSAVRSLEQGRTFPSVQRLDMIATAVGCQLQDLLAVDGDDRISLKRRIGLCLSGYSEPEIAHALRLFRMILEQGRKK